MTNAPVEKTTDHAGDTSEAATTKNRSSLMCEECLKESVLEDNGPG